MTQAVLHSLKSEGYQSLTWNSMILPKKLMFSKHQNKMILAITISNSSSYSVDSIKHTVLLKVLLQIFLLISIKSTVHWKFSRQINFAYCLY